MKDESPQAIHMYHVKGDLYQSDELLSIGALVSHTSTKSTDGGETIEMTKTSTGTNDSFKPNPEAKDDRNRQIRLTWRSWVVVFVSSFALIAQVFVITAAGSVIVFIVRDLGDEAISGWVIQGPLLMQCVLSPIVGRLSDVLDRKYLTTIPPLIAFGGAVMSARATSMAMLIGGGILNGVAVSTVPINQSIPCEVLPLKFRPLANGIGYIAGSLGAICGGLLAGGLTNASPGGWRYLFWVEAALHLSASLGLLLFYHPPRRSDYPKMPIKEYIWACDPIGSILFIAAVTMLLLALNWAGQVYPWSDAHVAGVLSAGLGLLVIFSIYEWKGRDDGLIAHILFQGSPNFALAVFAFAAEGWVYFSPVNTLIQQLTLHLGYSKSSWIIALRQLSVTVTATVMSLFVTLYATKSKDLKSPLAMTLAVFLVGAICYTFITPEMAHAQIGFNILLGVGISASLALIIATVQFCAPHTHLSTATGLAFSSRAIGGAVGSAVENAVVQGTLNPRWTDRVSRAAVDAGLPVSSVPLFLHAMQKGGQDLVADVPGVNVSILASAQAASQGAYAHAYHRAWACTIPLIVLALVAVLCLKDVSHLMTEKIEATVEKRGREA